VSVRERSNSAKFRVCSFDSGDATIDVSGEVQFDKTLNEVPDTLTFFGGQAESLALMRLVGGLVTVQNLSVIEGEQRKFVGRLLSVAAVHKNVDEEITRIAELAIEKTITEFDRGLEEAGTNHCSYTYATDVAGWPTSGMFGTSYKGTIEAHEFDDGLHRLLKADDLNLTATPHYFFRTEGRRLIRQSLASIHLHWTRERLDEKRLLDCARLVLSFLYSVKLRPLIKTHATGCKYRHVCWNAADIETAERDRLLGPIRTDEQQAFQEIAIQTLFESGIAVELLDAIVDRYVESQTDVTLQRSFAHGCEAIEGMYALLKARAPAPAAPDYSEVRSKLKAVVEREVADEEDRAVACSKIDQLFAPPTWPRIKTLIMVLANNPKDLIHTAIARANFFKYRNLSSHGQVVRLNNEVVLQATIMRFVIEWMFIKLAGAAVTPQIEWQLGHELRQADPPDRGIIQLWE